MIIRIHNVLRFFGIARRKNGQSYSIKFSRDRIAQIIREMNDLMTAEQPFLQHGYSIKSLAEKIKIPSYQLSALLNRQMGTNFNDYLNRHRITYCKRLIQDGSAGNLNLKGLSSKCGFNNRNTFTVAFKKFTGHTPSDYARQFTP